jgi:glutamate/tyrosine decarboxylase-like PLP-dependent enzyme
MADDTAVGAWGWKDDEFEHAAQSFARIALEHLRNASTGPVFSPVPLGLASRMRDEVWEDQGASLDQLTAQVREILRYPFGNGHPRFHAWVNSPPDRAAVLAGLAAVASNPSCAGGNHMALHLERQVIRWLADMIGMPTGSGGLLMSGASLVTITALASARHAHAGFDVRTQGLSGNEPLTVYSSVEAHSCVTKAVELLGIGTRNLRLLPTDQDFRLDPARLDLELQAGRARGERPIAVVACAGTVSTGAIDPLDEIAAVCERHNVWLHIDGAYGAPGILSERYRERLVGLGRADSVALDPHKWLYVPVDAGALLVRRPDLLRAAFTLVPSYLKVEYDPEGMSDAPWLSEYGPEQTRPFRALRVWAAMRSTGRAGYTRLIDHDLNLASHLADRIRAHPMLELDAHGLSIVCFHHIGDDALQTEIARRIQLEGESFITTATVRGHTVLRACFVNPLTSADDVDALVDLVVETAKAPGSIDRGD